MGAGKDLWHEWDTLVVKHDVEGLVSLFTSDAVYAGPTFRVERTHALRAFFEGYDKAFSDTRAETSRVVEDGDIVVAEWTDWETHTGPFVMPDGVEIAATGNTVEFTGVTVSQIRDGKFVSMREYFDAVPLIIALGLMPTT